MRFSKALSDASNSNWDGFESEGGVSMAWAMKEGEGLWKWVFLEEEEEIRKGCSEGEGDEMVTIPEPLCLWSLYLVLVKK